MLFKRLKKENKGISLVELLVAISIAAIVAGSIAFFLTTSMRMYNRETVETTLQQELQATINQLVDYAAESETIVADFDGNAPDYLAFGTFKSVSGAGVLDKTTLEAQIVWQDGNKLYLLKADIANFCVSSNPAEASFGKIDKSKIEALIPSPGTASDANLLAQYVKGFSVTEVGGISDITASDGSVIGQGFENPLSVTVNVEFEKNATGQAKEKRVKDTAYLRNRVTNDIYVNIIPDVLPNQADKMCSLIKENSVSIETTTVSMEKNAGVIQIPGDERGGLKEDLNILEIVPGYSYDYVQYVIGGEDGKLLNTANTTYGASAGEAPVTPEELEGYFIRTAGYPNSSNTVYSAASFYPNQGADIQAMPVFSSKPRVGYYEYVGENKGVYAIESIKAKMAPAVDKGYGDTKPVIKYFVYDTYGNNTDNTGRYYNPSFEFVDPDNVQVNTWFYPASKTDGDDYDEVTISVNNGSGGTVDKTIYQYVGKGNGNCSVIFGNPTQTYNLYYACYQVIGDVNDAFVGNDGKYCAYNNNEWEHRTDTSNYAVGFDYSDSIEDVVMYSKYYSETPSINDYGWVWHEENEGAIYDGIVKDEKITSKAVIDGETYKNYTSPSDYCRIYLKNHERNAVLNNETFKLYVLQDVFEYYTPNNMMDIRYGLWDTDRDAYCEVNKTALSSWEERGHKISLNVRTPGDVTMSDIENCDMIIIGCNGDGGFDYANSLYGGIKGTSVSSSYSAENDLTFANMLAIYKKIIANKASIACPYTIISAGGSKGSTNLGRLFEMLYCIVNEDVTKESIVDETVNKAKLEKIKKQGKDSNYWTVDPSYLSNMPGRVLVQGSGRELFTDYIKSMEDEALSKPLYNMEGGLKHKTTDFIYIEETGENAGSLIVPAKNETVEGYYFKNSAKVISTWGGAGGSGLSAFDTNILQWNTNRYLADRYRSAYNGYNKTAFVWNAVYNHFYKFSCQEPQEGIYRNQLVWNQTSDLLRLSKAGSIGGMIGLQTIRNNTNNGGIATSADIIGTLNYVGADLEAGAVERRNNQGDTSLKKFSDMPDYSMKIVELPDYISDPSKPGSVVTKKVLYLSEEEFRKAQDEGLYLYVLVKSTKDPSNYNKCVLWYEKNEKDEAGKPLTGRVDYEDFNYDPKNNDSHPNSIKYARGNRTDEAYVREYRYHVPAEYFRNLAPPYNNKNNMIVARIDKTAEREYEGNDTLYIYIRDTFDLD